MRNVRLQTIPVSVVTARCQFQGDGCPDMNKFEQFSSDDHQMSVAEGGYPRSHVGGGWMGIPGLMSLPCALSHDTCDVTYPPPQQKMPVKTLPSGSYCCGR